MYRRKIHPSVSSVADALLFVQTIYEGSPKMPTIDKKTNGSVPTNAFVPAFGKDLQPAIAGEVREKPFYTLSKMADGDAIQGVVTKADFVSFGAFDADGNEVSTDVPRYQLRWPGTEDFGFMGNSVVSDKAGDIVAGDYIYIRRKGTTNSRSGHNVIEVDVIVAKKGTFKLPALPVASESSETTSE